MVEKAKNKKNNPNLALLVALIFLGIALLAIHSTSISKHHTGKVIYNPDTCSEDNISDMWDSIFNTSAWAYEGVTILNNSDCSNFYAYRLDYTDLINLLYYENQEIVAISGRFEQDLLDLVMEDNLSKIALEFESFSFPPEQENNFTKYSKLRVPSINTPEEEFTGIFDTETHDWQEMTDPLNSSHSVYIFSNTSQGGANGNQEANYSEGGVYANSSLSYFGFFRTQDCTPNWTVELGECYENETQVKYYVDSNDCGYSTGKPENETAGCDYDENNLIGNLSHVDVSRVNLEIDIDDDDLNISKTYSGKRDVEFFNNGNEIVEFEWDFDEKPLNFNEIYVKVQSSSSNVGYIIVNGVEEEKEVTLDKLSNDSEAVCIKNSTDVNSLSDFEDDCSANDEYYLECPGSVENYSCSIPSSEDKFVVNGLTHSGVIEFTNETSNDTDDEDVGCTPDWNCTEWSECSGGLKYRTCTDLNSCGTTSGKPLEEDTCTVAASCTPDWSCTDWSPEDCPSSGEQTRTCTDLNDCGVSTGKPSETQTCEPSGAGILLWIFIIIFLALIAVVAFFFFKKSKKPSGPAGAGFGGAQPPGRPRGMPPGPRPRPRPAQPPQRINPNRMPRPGQMYPHPNPMHSTKPPR